jgi:hypothetical protein
MRDAQEDSARSAVDDSRIGEGASNYSRNGLPPAAEMVIGEAFHQQ